jgi:hypothetical protein
MERSGSSKLAEVIHEWLPSKIPLIPFLPTATKPKNASRIEKWRLLNNSGESEL